MSYLKLYRYIFFFSFPCMGKEKIHDIIYKVKWNKLERILQNVNLNNSKKPRHKKIEIGRQSRFKQILKV